MLSPSKRFWLPVSLCVALLSATAVTLPVRADDSKPSDTKTATAAAPSVGELRQKGVAYLKQSQSADGSWTAPNVAGITGLCVTSLLHSNVPVSDPSVAKGLKFLEDLKRDDGGIYHSESLHKNYETSIAVMAFVAANKDGRYTKTIKAADAFLRGLQWDESEDIKPEDPAYGGAGYGKHQRPDLSNTSFFLDALKAAGAKADDPAYQKALKFVSRCQNLETEHNTLPFPAKVNDGGFYYTPAAGGNSQAGTTPNGGLRSYASLTYAGLKIMLYAGVSKDDQRVKAATEWVRKHYSLEENPGLGPQGLYYYYHTFAKSLSTMGVDEFEDAKGTKHNWRHELLVVLKSSQKANGSWVNPNDRWYEGDPNIVTAYALLTLEFCETKPVEKK